MHAIICASETASTIASGTLKDTRDTRRVMFRRRATLSVTRVFRRHATRVTRVGSGLRSGFEGQ